jgi:hypothetical protein
MSNTHEGFEDHEFAAEAQESLLSLTYFEGWLFVQEDRMDEASSVARFVLRDIERGCWPRRRRALPYSPATIREELVEFEQHLICVHAFPHSSTQTFRQVYEEYRRENDPTTSATLRDLVSEVLLYTMYRWEDPMLSSVEREPVAPDTRRRLRRMISDYTHRDSAALAGIIQCVAEQLRLPQGYEEVLEPIAAKEIKSLESLGWHGLLPF